MNEKITPQPSESQLSLSLLENGLDFILKGMDELFGENHALKNAKATEVETRNYKYGITNLFSGFLLLLKERLSRHIPELIFVGRLSEIKLKLQPGKKIPNTVDLDEALERLEIGPKVTFSQDELEVIKKIQDFRNQFEHYKVTGNKYQLWAEISNFVDIIEKFLHKELGIELEKYSKESKSLHEKAEALRDTVVKFDSIIEKEVYDVLSALSGKEVPGLLLGTDKNITLPTVSPTQEPYSIKNKKYIPDFVGKDAGGIKWVVEVKGAYIHTTGISVLERLLSIQKQSPKTKIWLIVVGEISNNAKGFAIMNHIYFTDINSWQQLKSLAV
jgi:hypothetical protein